MKKQILCVVAAVSALSCFAKHVSEAQAYAVAASVLPGRVLTTTPISRSGADALYVFNAEDANGFAIVSADDRTPAILGYSDTGNFSFDNLPSNVQWVIDYYRNAIEELNIAGTPVKAQMHDWDPIHPLVNTKWNQGEPYNSMCPKIGNSYCQTGCVATAMAQIINYHQWPVGPINSIDEYYSVNVGNVDALPATTINWANMTDGEIAKLMRYCGQSVSMTYGLGSSGASVSSARDAFVDTFGYSKNAELVHRSDFSTSDWTYLIYKELSMQCPVLYGGTSNMKGGHSFVVDGYTSSDDNADMFHINWGWGGYCDGYFVLDGLDPENQQDPFVYCQCALIGIISPSFGAYDSSEICLNNLDIGAPVIERGKNGDAFDNFMVDICVSPDIYINNPVQLALGLYDMDGNIISLFGEQSVNLESEGTYDYQVQVELPTSLTDKQYLLVPVNRGANASKWQKDINTRSTYILVLHEGDHVIVIKMPNNNGEIVYTTAEVDGVWYRFENFYGFLNAFVTAIPDGTKYEGDITIPEYVEFAGFRWPVYLYDYNFAESNINSLTANSIDRQIHLNSCSSLKTLILNNTSVFSIFNCDSLEELVLPSNLRRVYGIELCENLKRIKIENVEKTIIDLFCTDRLPNLSDIYIYSDIPPVLKESVLREDINVHIPVGSIQAYMCTDWVKCKLIEDISPRPVEVKFSYCGDDNDNNSFIGSYMGDNAVEYAIRIPSEHLGDNDHGYIGAKITAIEFYSNIHAINEYYSGDVEYVFVTVPGVDYIAKTPVNVVRGTWQRVELESPVEITGQDLYIGVGRNGSFMFPWATDEHNVDGCWTRTMGDDHIGCNPGEWVRGAGDKSLERPIALRAIVKGDNLPNDICILSSSVVDKSGAPLKAHKRELNKETVNTFPVMGEISVCENIDGVIYKTSQNLLTQQSVDTDMDGFLQVKMVNRCTHPVTKVGMSLSVDDIDSEQSVDTYMLTNRVATAKIKINGDPAKYVHSLNAWVNKINDDYDEVKANSIINLNYQSKPISSFARKYVLEESVGTWCGWCPRGIVTVDRMLELYPDNFIDISVHNNDPMVVNADYGMPFFELMAGAGVPSGVINRTEMLVDVDPYYITEIMDGHLDDAIASIQISSATVCDGKLQVEGDAVFGFNDNGSADFSVAYAIVEDCVGPYIQTNYYSAPAAPDNPEDMLNWWTHQKEAVPTMFDNVARDIFGGFDGVREVFPQRIVEGTAYSINQTIDIPANIDDVRNVKVVAMLIYTSTGEIINADVKKVTVIDGISAIMSDSDCDDNYYDLLGRPVLYPTPGIYIHNHRKVYIK